MLRRPLPQHGAGGGMDADHRSLEQVLPIARPERTLPRARWRREPAALVFAGEGNRFDQRAAIVADMGALGEIAFVAVPFERDVEPGKAWRLSNPASTGRRFASALPATPDACADRWRCRNDSGLRRASSAAHSASSISRRPCCEMKWKKLNSIACEIAGSSRASATEGARRQHRDLRLRKTLLQPPHRRQRGDEIADVVELLHEDAPHAFARDQRRAGDDDARRLGVRRIVGGVAAETRMKERIAQREG